MSVRQAADIRPKIAQCGCYLVESSLQTRALHRQSGVSAFGRDKSTGHETASSVSLIEKLRNMHHHAGGEVMFAKGFTMSGR